MKIGEPLLGGCVLLLSNLMEILSQHIIGGKLK